MAAELPQIPFDRPAGIGSPPDVELLGTLGPVVRVRTPNGKSAWLLTRYDDIRFVLSDARFRAPGSIDSLAEEYGVTPLFRVAGSPMSVDGAEHRRLRAALTPAFTVRRLDALRPTVRAIVEDLLDALEQQTPPVDLHTHVSFSLPMRVLCELLGVPASAREQYSEWSNTILVAPDGDFDASAAGWEKLHDHVRELLHRKRAEPDGDLISDLAAADALSDGEACALAAVVLVAGLETTFVQIEYGLVALHQHPEQLAALRRDPGLAPTAVEEMLRLFPPRAVSAGFMRFLVEDVEIAGTRLPAGSCVLLSAEAAAMDPTRFEHPDRFDIGRRFNPHMAFGHGPHHCVGAALARLELTELFAKLFVRFPEIRPVLDPVTLQVKTRQLNGGFEELSVTW
jgi:cytochrome P450